MPRSVTADAGFFRVWGDAFSLRFNAIVCGESITSETKVLYYYARYRDGGQFLTTTIFGLGRAE